MKEIVYAILATMILAIFFYSGRYLTLMDKRHEMKLGIKPCNHLTPKECILYYERYEMHLNKGNKDSIAKYARLLNF